MGGLECPAVGPECLVAACRLACPAVVWREAQASAGRFPGRPRGWACPELPLCREVVSLVAEPLAGAFPVGAFPVGELAESVVACLVGEPPVEGPAEALPYDLLQERRIPGGDRFRPSPVGELAAGLETPRVVVFPEAVRQAEASPAAGFRGAASPGAVSLGDRLLEGDRFLRVDSGAARRWQSQRVCPVLRPENDRHDHKPSQCSGWACGISAE